MPDGGEQITVAAARARISRGMEDRCNFYCIITIQQQFNNSRLCLFSEIASFGLVQEARTVCCGDSVEIPTVINNIYTRISYFISI